jgi:hypothetical protein
MEAHEEMTACSPRIRWKGVNQSWRIMDDLKAHSLPRRNYRGHEKAQPFQAGLDQEYGRDGVIRTLDP